VNSLPKTATRQRRDCDSNPCSEATQQPRACGPVISAVARAPPGSVSTPTEKHIDDRDPSDHDGSIDQDI